MLVWQMKAIGWGLGKITFICYYQRVYEKENNHSRKVWKVHGQIKWKISKVATIICNDRRLSEWWKSYEIPQMNQKSLLSKT